LEALWIEIKQTLKEIAMETRGHEPKKNNREWFDGKCALALQEKNEAYRRWISRPTRAKRTEYEKLRKIAHKICRPRKVNVWKTD
jgi:hypothetical protein